MNLHGIVGPMVGAINPLLPATVQFFTGSVTNPNGTRSPSYASPPSTVLAQVQPMTYRDLMQVDSLNLQGTRVSIYVSGEIDAIIRVGKKGGDLITIKSGVHAGVYLTALVLEQWDSWVKVAATLQNGA
jgi:hypothetical protein